MPKQIQKFAERAKQGFSTSNKKSLIDFSNQRGLVFTLEATLALILFGLVLFTLPTQNATSLKELAITQQANDLLRVWSAQGWSEEELVFDTAQMFGEKAEVFLGEKKLNTIKKEKNAIATEGTLLDEKLNEFKIKIIVYYK